jgi:hypothetical protein
VDSLTGNCINLGALENRFGAIRLPDGIQVGTGVSLVQAAFVTSLAGYERSDRPSNYRSGGLASDAVGSFRYCESGAGSLTGNLSMCLRRFLTLSF